MEWPRCSDMIFAYNSRVPESDFSLGTICVSAFFQCKVRGTVTSSGGSFSISVVLLFNL